MASPFPGMDPYLESPAIWPDMHQRLATVLSDELNAQLPSHYYAQLEMRTELGIIADDFNGSEDEGATRRIVPDVLVLRHPRPRESVGVAVAEVARPAPSRHVAFERLSDEPLRHHYVEIRDASRGHKLVTLIEILSPSNKLPGPDRATFSDKQKRILESDASLVEIDLLRAGRRILPSTELETAVGQLDPPVDYVVFVSTAWMRQPVTFGYTAYPATLREWLPSFIVPLRPEDAELILDLQWVFRRAYEGGPYLRGAVDYSAPLDPPLRAEDQAWANALLLEAGLRGR